MEVSLILLISLLMKFMLTHELLVSLTHMRSLCVLRLEGCYWVESSIPAFHFFFFHSHHLDLTEKIIVQFCIWLIHGSISHEIGIYNIWYEAVLNITLWMKETLSNYKYISQSSQLRIVQVVVWKLVLHILDRNNHQN